MAKKSTDLMLCYMFITSCIIIVRGLNFEANTNNDGNFNEISNGFTIKNKILYGVEEVLKHYSTDLGQTLLNKLDSKPNHVWQINANTGRKTTYANAKENSIRVALWMQKQNIGYNDIVSICSPNHDTVYIPFLAIFYVGAAFNGWQPNISLERARHYMLLTKPKIIFVTASDVEVIKEAAKLENHEVKIIVFGTYPGMQSLEDTLKSQRRTEVKNFQSVPIKNPEVIATIQFSSGSSGVHKGTEYTYENFARIVGNDLWFSGGKGSVGLWYSPISWITGTNCMLQSIMHDTTRIVHATFDPEETCKVIEKFQVSYVFLPPTMISFIAKSNVLKNYQLKSLKILVTGGSRIGPDVIYQFKNNLPHTSFISAYGMSELAGGISAQNKHSRIIESVGFIRPGAQLKIVDLNTGKNLGPNKSGEIRFKSPTMIVRYYNNPKATKEAFDEEGWFHTGDLGYYDENGEIVVVDRLKDLIKNRGYHVAPSEIEEILMGYPGVKEAVVVGKPHPLYIEEAMAFVKKSPNSQVSEQDLVNFSFQYGHERRLFGGVKFLESIPVLSTGKVDKVSLKALAKTYVQ